MNRILSILINFLIFLTGITGFAQELNKFDLNGEWQFRKAGSKEWQPAHVPGVVQLDLLNNKTIPDPYYRDNESKVQWVGEIGWEYQKTFTYDKDNYASRHIELVCKGLDTYANVFVNDSLVMVADNMFKDWTAEVKRFLRIGANTIRIQFPSIVVENKARYSQLRYKLPGDEKVVSRKAAYQFGWDWGPTLITSGIWRPVYLNHWNYAKVLGVQFIQKKLTDSMAVMSAIFTILSDKADTAEIKLFGDSTLIFKQPVVLRAGPNLIRGDFGIGHPELWWPNGMGNSTLYNFSWQVDVAGKQIGQGHQRVGLRTIELIRDPDSAGRSFYFKVNGIPCFFRGANYVPQDNFLPRVSDSMYTTLLNDVKDAGINMLRVWGGGIYENDIFYDICDQNGIMVWQDFMFACAMYPGGKDFLNSVRDEVIQNIVRLRGHPSIALWCGNNEIDEGWKNWGWQKQYAYSKEDSTEIHRIYRTIFNEIIPNGIRRFDTLRAYIPSSPLNGWGRPQSLTEGDMHYWGVWWGKEPFSNYLKKIPRFMSEYGFQGFPDPSTIERITLPEDRTLGSAVMKAHQKHKIGYETIDEYLLRDYRKPKDFDSYNYVSQVLQAEGMSVAIQAHRRAKPYCMGTMYWQLNDCWPVVSWSSRDGYGKKKALWYEVQKQYSKILISPVVEDGHIKVYISSDQTYIEKGTMKLKMYDFNGKLLLDEMYYVDIPANTSDVYYDTLQSALLNGIDPKNVVFSARLAGLNGLLSENNLYFAEPKALNLPKPTTVMRAFKIPEGYKIQIITDLMVKNAMLTSSVPGEFKDNYFDILPGEIYEVLFYTAVKDPKITEKILLKSLVDSF
jgi:beta-mannosidase